MKRLLGWLLAVCLGLGVLAPGALAAEDTAMAGQLQVLGLFKGTEKGFELDRAMSRVEAVVMLVRALGKGEAAESHAKTHPFTDVPAWADGYVSYAYEAGLTKGVSETAFGAGDRASAEMYLTFMLRALGYQEGTAGQFLWDAPWSAAGYAGILPPEVDRHDFLREDAVTVTCAALYAKVWGAETLLHEKLEGEGAFTTEAFAAAFPADPLARYRALDAKITEAMERRGWVGPTETVNEYAYECHILGPVQERDGTIILDALVCTTRAEVTAENTLGGHGGGMGPWRVTLDAGSLDILSVESQGELLNAGVPYEESSAAALLADQRALDRGAVWFCAALAQEAITSGKTLFRPLTYEEQLAELARSSGYSETKRLESELCTVVLYEIGGTPRGSFVGFTLVYKDGSPLGGGTRIGLPLPADRSWGGTGGDPVTLELSADGKTLTYSYHFDERLVNMEGTDEEWVVHEKGTYSYTTDLATGETRLEIVGD